MTSEDVSIPIFYIDVDFRVRNTFIEWAAPQSRAEKQTLQRCVSWDGVCNPALASLSKSLCRRQDTGKGVQSAGDLAQSYPLSRPSSRNSSMNNPDPQDWVHSLIQQGETDSSISHAFKEVASENNTAWNMAYADDSRSRRPSKQKRRQCTQIIEFLISFYSHDRATLSKIAWGLAAKSSYMRGLCLKYEIEPDPHGGQDIILHEMPRQFQNLWARVHRGEFE